MKEIARRFYDIFYEKIFHHLTYIQELEQQLSDCKSVLDLGCGSSSPIKKISRNFYSVGLDISESLIEKSKKAKIHNEYIRMNLLDIDKKLQSDSFDCVLLLDVMEHLEKNDAIRLMGIMEKIAKKKVIIFTPNGFIPQEENDGNLWQIHKSGWSVEEMRVRGYKVIGINGWSVLRRGKARLKFSPEFLWLMISDITQLFVRNRPERAFQILCVKDI